MLRFTFYLLTSVSLVAILALGGLLWLIVPDLPQTADLSDTHLQTPMRVMTNDGKLIAEFGEKRRHPVAVDDVPLFRASFGEFNQNYALRVQQFIRHPKVVSPLTDESA